MLGVVAAFWFLVDNMVVILAVIVDFSGLVGFVAADFSSKKSNILARFLVFLLISGCLFGLGGGVVGFRGRGVSSNFDFFFNFLFFSLMILLDLNVLLGSNFPLVSQILGG